jgi:hypothetical protein
MTHARLSHAQKGGAMNNVTFHIRQTEERGQTFFEVWRKSCDSYGECWESMLAEADNSTDARDLLQHFVKTEDERQARVKGSK